MRTRAVVLFAVLAVFLSAGALPAADGPIFTLKDYIGRHWQHELVEYRITPARAKNVAGRKLVDSAGREALYQLDPERGTLVFQANVEPYSRNTYSFTKAPASAKTDIAVRETAEYVELANSCTGIRIAKTLNRTTTRTPILSWRLASGGWVGRTVFTEPQDIASCKTTVVERGPVRSRLSCRVEFADGSAWVISCELLSHEPVVKLSETFNCEKKRYFEFVFSDGFPAAYALLRSSSRQLLNGVKYEYGTIIRRPLNEKEDRVLLLEPWVHWGGVPTRTTSFSLTDAEWRDVVFLSASSPEKWVDPHIGQRKRAQVGQWLKRDDDGRVSITFELAHGGREYLIGSVPGGVDSRNYEARRRVPTQAQVHQMRYSDFPLDRVKGYVLEWPSEGLLPAAFLAEADRQELLKNYKLEPDTLERLRSQTPTMYTMEEYIPCYLVTKDRVLERKLVEFAIGRVQERLDQLSKLEGAVITVGWAPHHFLSLMTTCNVISTIYDSPTMTARERAKLRGHLAFLAYLLNRDAYCSPERGFAGFPNMTACAYGVRAALAAVVPGHPMQAEWLGESVRDLRVSFLDKWLDKDGRWDGRYAESLTYTRLTFDIVLGALYRSYSSGVGKEALFHPAIKRVGQWYAESATPRDSRILNWRHLPPVGHVYKFDVAPALHAMLAFMWKDRDPEFAAHMKWMQLQQGNTRFQATGGFVPSFAGYRKLFMANTVVPKAPHYESRVWPETSVILRNHYGDPLENMLYMIAGEGHSHYDRDSGSITLWGKGEIIADDFGYYGYAPAEDHSMIDSPVAPPEELMRIVAFDKGPAVDYVRGEKAAWTRRCFLVKHEKPQDPNYYVIQDALSVKAPAYWRLWLTAKSVALRGHRALSSGLHRVDTDIHFANLPEAAAVTTEDKTRNPCGLNSKGDYPGKNPTTQTGIIINAPNFRRLLMLVFPRLKGEKPPTVAPIADGRGFKLATPYGTDYVFLSDKPTSYVDGKLTFKGTAGFARVFGDQAVLDLKEAGEISFGKKRLVKKAEAGGKTANLIADGELLKGK